MAVLNNPMKKVVTSSILKLKKIIIAKFNIEFNSLHFCTLSKSRQHVNYGCNSWSNLNKYNKKRYFSYLVTPIEGPARYFKEPYLENYLSYRAEIFTQYYHQLTVQKMSKTEICKNERKYWNITTNFIFALSRRPSGTRSRYCKSHISETIWATGLRFLHNITFNRLFKKCHQQQSVKMKESSEKC